LPWKVLGFTILIVLTLTIVAYNIILYSIPARLYLSSGKFALPFPSSLTYITLANVSYSERSGIQNYLKAGDIITGNYIDVSDVWCPIHSWAESMFKTYRSLQRADQATFILKLSEDEYYQVYLWQRKMYNPSDFEYYYNAILNIATVSLWVVFTRSALRKENET